MSKCPICQPDLPGEDIKICKECFEKYFTDKPDNENSDTDNQYETT